jgi:hypothetical protein
MRDTMETMSDAAKKELHQLVDSLPESELHAARQYLVFLRDEGTDPYAHLERDDEMDAEEREKLHASLERGLAEARRGEGRPVEEFLAEFEEP